MSLKSEGEAAGRRAESYLETVERLEPSFAMVDRDAALTSIAISLRRIADVAEKLFAEAMNDKTSGDTDG